jgi:twitching motility protein PilJ
MRPARPLRWPASSATCSPGAGQAGRQPIFRGQHLIAQGDTDLSNAYQQAILRLMNEMGDLADGDLTVRATVTEDITGAIADSVNYTIEELSVLVRRINDAAGRVTAATESAQRTSTSCSPPPSASPRKFATPASTAQSMASP